MSSGVSLTVAAALTIGVAWLVGVVCLYQKYKRDQKACTVADFFKLTFSALTLALSGYLVLNISFPMWNRDRTIVERIAPLMDYQDGAFIHPRWIYGSTEEESNEARMDREARAAKIDEIVGIYLSNFGPTTWVGSSGLPGEGSILINGTPGFPMVPVMCVVSSVQAGPPPASLDETMVGSYLEKRASCNMLERG